jgi:hypothetical protein
MRVINYKTLKIYKILRLIIVTHSQEMVLIETIQLKISINNQIS